MTYAQAAQSGDETCLYGERLLVDARPELRTDLTVPVRQTRPAACPFLNNGCYAQRGPGGHVARLEANARRLGLDAPRIAHEEARLIRAAARRLLRLKRCGVPLRVHVSGDCASAESASIVSNACSLWPGPVWSYTHAWREVPREHWGSVSVLASVERPEDANLARSYGYAAAITVAKFPNGTRSWVEGGSTWLPCLNETIGKTCAQCRLCFNADGLRERRRGIAFSVHGSGKLVAARALVRIRNSVEASSGRTIAEVSS